MNRLSLDALILRASMDVETRGELPDSRLNSALAGAAYSIGYFITEGEARLGLQSLRSALKRARRLARSAAGDSGGRGIEPIFIDVFRQLIGMDAGGGRA